MTAFLRFSQRKDMQYYQPDIPGPSGGNGNGFIHAIAAECVGRLHLDRYPDFDARSALRIRPRSCRQSAAVSGRAEYGIAVRHSRACRPRRTWPAD